MVGAQKVCDGREKASTLAKGAGRDVLLDTISYWIALPTCENTLLALEPISRTVPTTMTRITANMTEYSATS
jgi:hypothetical protein